MIDQDTVIKLAKQAGIIPMNAPCDPDYAAVIERFATLVAAAEREECAQECKFDRSAADIEISIRARSQA